MPPDTITVYNPRPNTVEAGGSFWPGRTETTKEVDEDTLHAVHAHPHLEIRSEQATTALEDMGKEQLIALAKQKGVSHTGNKDDIIESIQSADEEEE